MFGSQFHRETGLGLVSKQTSGNWFGGRGPIILGNLQKSKDNNHTW